MGTAINNDYWRIKSDKDKENTQLLIGNVDDILNVYDQHQCRRQYYGNSNVDQHWDNI